MKSKSTIAQLKQFIQRANTTINLGIDSLQLQSVITAVENGETVKPHSEKPAETVKPHSEKLCGAIKKICRSCKKVGHFEKVCRSKSKGRPSQIRNRGAGKPKQNEQDGTRIRALKRQEAPTKQLQQVQQSVYPEKEKLVSSNSDSSDEDVFSLSNSRREKQPPVAKLKLEKVKIDFLVDTGATVNILTAGDYQRMCDVLGKRFRYIKLKLEFLLTILYKKRLSNRFQKKAQIG